MQATLDRYHENTVTHVSSADNERYFIVAYDISAKSHRRTKIYRTLNRIYHQLVSKGVEAERIQLSVWLVRGRENALWLAKVIPRDIAKVEVYEVSEKIL